MEAVDLMTGGKVSNQNKAIVRLVGSNLSQARPIYLNTLVKAERAALAGSAGIYIFIWQSALYNYSIGLEAYFLSQGHLE